MRLYFLDNLKVALISLVVVHHAGQAYGPTDYWPIRSDEQIALLGPFFEINGAFFMGLFFLISAFFLPRSVDRKGVGTAVRDRLMRLGIPLLFMTILVFGPLTYLVDGIDSSFWRYMLFDYLGTGDLELAHLWFVSLLLFFSLCYLLLRLLSANSRPITSEAAAETPSNLLIAGLIVVLLSSNALIRIWFPVGVWVNFSPILPVEVGRLPQYAIMFTLGLIACRRGWLTTMPLAQAVIWFLLGLLAAASAFVNLLTEILPPSIWLLQEAVIGVAWCLSLPVLARELWHRSNELMRRLSDDAFAVYLIHIIVIYVLQQGFEETDLNVGLRFALVSILGLLISFLLADLLRRVPGLRRYL